MIPLRSSLLALLFAVAGCESITGPLSPGERQDLREAKARWASKGSQNYTVESRLSCFCPTYLAYWTKVTVRNGVVVAAEPLSPLPDYSEPTRVEGWSTVPELFARIEHRDRYLKNIDVAFDPVLGYPTQVSIECTPDVADCGSSYSTRNLTIP
jgi:hypothetical protein